MIRDELDRSVPIRRTRRRCEEVADVSQMVAQLTADVGPLGEGMHLVNPYPVEAVRVGLECVEHGHRLPVRQWDDEIGAAGNMSQDVFGPTDLFHWSLRRRLGRIGTFGPGWTTGDSATATARRRMIGA
jgi:hypothetical protein